MKSLSVGIFHDDAIARELGKKDTESDIVILSRKMGEHVFTFMYPVEDKLSAKSQIASSIDAAIVAFKGPSRELGETLVMLDSLGISRGIAITSPYATPEQIADITKGTSAESFTVGNTDSMKMLQLLTEYEPRRDTASPTVVAVDHSFSVKGVGEVILGFVKKGVVRKYDVLTLLPAGKEVTVRSIQLQDEEFDEAQTGARVGLAIKGATVEEMSRGSTLSAPNAMKTSSKLKLDLKKSLFYPADLKQGVYHATVGMQTMPVTVTEIDEASIILESEKPIVFSPDDQFLLLDLNAKKMRVVGTARENHPT